MSYMQITCIIIICNNVHLAQTFLCDFIQYKTRSAFFQKFWKNYNNSAPQQAMLAKNISISSYEISILHAKFCTIPSSGIRDRITIRILGKTGQQRPLLSYVYPNYIIIISNDIYFVHKFSCNSIQQKPRSAYPKNFE